MCSMRSKILCIQFRKSEKLKNREQVSIQRETKSHSEVDFISILESDIDWSNPKVVLGDYDGLILGGSGDFDFDGNREENDPARLMSYEFLKELAPLFEYIFEQDVPTLGICYGHQLLGAFAGANVLYDEAQKKTKSHEVRFVVDKQEHFLFANLPESFSANYGHKDCLDRVPEGAVLIMNGGDQCKVSVLKYKNNIYTTQFHPELNFEDMIIRAKDSIGYLPEGDLGKDIFKDEPHANTILQNFSKFVANRARSKESV